MSDHLEMNEEQKATRDYVIVFGCLSTLLCLVPIIACSGVPLLAFHWIQWQAKNVDDYQINVRGISPEFSQEYQLTVCDGTVVEVECLGEARGSEGQNACPYSRDGGDPSRLQWLTIDSLYSETFEGFDPFGCNAQYDPEDHYPNRVGCITPDHYLIQVSEFASLTCSD